MIDLSKIQGEQKRWSKKNFGDQPSYRMILGMIEELGELSHAHLKSEQNIRSGLDHHQNRLEKKDALGDLVVFMLGYCNDEGFDLEQIITTTWEQVKRRDWKSNPENANKQNDEQN